ncbi:hypothetical protein FIBSPDRAFT_903092 [Athelia psychrophila]|uniref:Uncharacterized protein n=1 Tax=Athelia psychrophila TaxID=1759441 RepID=A0A167WF94_9AGAM|nr:hypothetical protein FIBSPDRAFT_903092 [Fibularhizoctonia sp. CBS 109695]
MSQPPPQVPAHPSRVQSAAPQASTSAIIAPIPTLPSIPQFDEPWTDTMAETSNTAYVPFGIPESPVHDQQPWETARHSAMSTSTTHNSGRRLPMPPVRSHIVTPAPYQYAPLPMRTTPDRPVQTRTIIPGRFASTPQVNLPKQRAYTPLPPPTAQRMYRENEYDQNVRYSPLPAATTAPRGSSGKLDFVRKPDAFDGAFEKFDDWWISVMTYIKAYPQIFGGNDENKILMPRYSHDESKEGSWKTMTHKWVHGRTSPGKSNSPSATPGSNRKHWSSSKPLSKIG